MSYKTSTDVQGLTATIAASAVDPEMISPPSRRPWRLQVRGDGVRQVDRSTGRRPRMILFRSIPQSSSRLWHVFRANHDDLTPHSPPAGVPCPDQTRRTLPPWSASMGGIRKGPPVCQCHSASRTRGPKQAHAFSPAGTWAEILNLQVCGLGLQGGGVGPSAS